jgi:hypothetical protein
VMHGARRYSVAGPFAFLVPVSAHANDHSFNMPPQI